MPKLNKVASTEVTYLLNCRYERAAALANDLCNVVTDDAIDHVYENTNGFYPDNKSIVCVVYRSLGDAVRLDAEVRKALSRSVNYSYAGAFGVGYGARGPYATNNPVTKVFAN